MGRLTENSVINLKNQSHTVSAGIELPDDGGEGVIIAQGGAFAGWALYMHKGRLTYCYNLLGIQRTKFASSEPLAGGAHEVRMDFTYDGGGLGKGGDVALYVDDVEVAAGRLEATVPLVFSADETCDLGVDSASPVSDDYTPESSKFTGRIGWVQLDVGEGQSDPATAEDRWRVAMARQ